jgi:hypothetical protein
LNLSKLLAQSFAQDMSELLELRRNMIYLNITSNTFKVISMKDSKAIYSSTLYGSSAGYYSDFGHSNVFIDGKEFPHFWPNEWENVLGGKKSINHFIQIFIYNQWKSGRIIDYSNDTKLYKFQFDSQTYLSINK